MANGGLRFVTREALLTESPHSPSKPGPTIWGLRIRLGLVILAVTSQVAAPRERAHRLETKEA